MRTPLSTLDEIWQCKSQLIHRFLTDIRLQLRHIHPKARLVLGCSGGMDSMLLVYLFATLKHHDADFQHELLILHVNHQLQSESDDWADFVQYQCERLNIPCEAIAVTVEKGNVEHQARQARYQVFLTALNPQDVLVLAHHQQDQAETVLLRLLQGTGVQGLAAMQKWQNRPFPHQFDQYYTLWRPLLDYRKEDIQDCINRFGIKYVQDPMNMIDDYDRVWCRQQLWSILQQRFPQMQNSIARCASLMHDAQQILNEVLQQDIEQCVDLKHHILKINRLKNRSLARQQQLLAWFIQAEQQYKAPLYIVQQLQHEVINAKDDAQGHLHYAGFHFVRYGNDLYRFQDEQWQFWQTLRSYPDFILEKNQKVELKIGTFQCRKQHLHHWGLSESVFGQNLTLKARQGGEKIAFPERQGRQSLKKYLQSHKVVTWQRPHVQCLWLHATLLGVFTPQGFWLAQSEYLVRGGWNFQLLSNDS